MSMCGHRSHATLKCQHIDVDCIPVQLHVLARDREESDRWTRVRPCPRQRASGRASRAVHSWPRMQVAPARAGPATPRGCETGRIRLPDRPAAPGLWPIEGRRRSLHRLKVWSCQTKSDSWYASMRCSVLLQAIVATMDQTLTLADFLNSLLTQSPNNGGDGRDMNQHTMFLSAVCN